MVGIHTILIIVNGGTVNTFKDQRFYKALRYFMALRCQYGGKITTSTHYVSLTIGVIV